MQVNSARGVAAVPDALGAFYDETGVPGAIRRGGVVWVTGQTGVREDGSVPSSPGEQMRRAFEIVGDCLAEAGVGWSDVVGLTSHVVGLREHGEEMIAIASEFLEVPLPAWTAVGVAELWEEGTMFELQCVAVADAGD